MKPKQFVLLAAILLLLAGMTTAAIAQPGNGYGYKHGRGQGQGMGKGSCTNIPDLTDDQKTKIEDLRTAHMKEMLPLRNKMGELKAKQRTLSTGDNADMKAINANIDEITKTQNIMMKKHTAHRREVRKLLTDTQKVWFDSHPPKGKGQGKGQCRGGQGRGYQKS